MARPWRVANCLLHLRMQVDAKFPVRRKDSDGTIGNALHAARTSDHNPWIVDGNYGVVSAMDITHDPAHGVDTYQMAEQLRVSGDPRLKYVISNHRIWSPTIATIWRPYNGENPHDHHVHISVRSVREQYDNVRDWVIPMLAGPLPPTVPPVTPEASNELHEHITATVFGGRSDPNKSAYDGHTITDQELGVALPYHFNGIRPKVRVFGPRGSAVGAIVDVGPWNTNDPYWLTPHARPQAESGRDRMGRSTNKAGIDLTPALAHLVGVDGKGLVNWEFVKV